MISKGICSITVYNHEGTLFDTDHRYAIKLRPRVEGIEYDPFKGPAHTQSSIYAKGFEAVVSFLLEVLNSTLGCQANHREVFYNPADYFAWRKNVEFVDADVAWYVQIENLDGKYVVYACTNYEPVPAELDQLELMVRESLEMV